MITTLNGMFAKPKPHRIDFIKENKKKLKEISSMVNQNNSKSRFDLTRTKSSQTEVSRSVSRSSTAFKENKSGCRLGGKSSVAILMPERRDRNNISNISLSPKQKSSQRVVAQKNQSCQTIDPRRCDQLYHDGVIKYPSNRVMQELAEIEKQKANRLDAHIKKEYFRRNKVKQKNPNSIAFPKVKMKGSGKGDEGDVEETSEDEEDKVEEKKEPQQGEVVKKEPEPTKGVKQPPSPTMRAAEIIRKTTEDINSPRGQAISEHSPSHKGDGRVVKKPPKKLSREEEVLKAVLDPQCPPGHIPLPDSERKKTLHMLRVSHAELVREMNLLPVRTDTLRIRQKKIQLENQLNKIEEGIKVFNKSKVYVKIEE